MVPERPCRLFLDRLKKNTLWLKTLRIRGYLHYEATVSQLLLGGPALDLQVGLLRTTDSTRPSNKPLCAKVMQCIHFSTLVYILAVINSVASINEQIFRDGGSSVSIRAVNASAVNAIPEPSPLFDLAEAASCYRSWERSAASTTTPSWRLCYPSKILASSDYESYTGTSIFRTIKRIGPGSIYEECDGITRFKPSPSATSISLTSEVSVLYRGWVLGNWTRKCESSLPEPEIVTCTVPKTFCGDLWASYRAADQIFAETEQIQTKSAPGRPVHPCGAEGQCELDLKQEIVLLYWPAKLASRDICADNGIGAITTVPEAFSSAVKTITEVPFRGVDLYRLAWVSNGNTETWNDPIIEPSVLTGHWVVTSPTILLAHRPITAYNYIRQDTDDEGGFTFNITTETIRKAGVIYLQSQDIYTSRPLLFKSNRGSDLAYKIANGLWRPEPGQLLAGEKLAYDVEPLDFGNLKDPVPASVYFDARSDCWGKQTHCATMTDDTYRPKLLIGGNVWRSVLSHHFYCNWPSVVDPPIVLSEMEPNLSPSKPQISGVPAIITPNSIAQEKPSYDIEKPAAPPRPGSRPLERPGPLATARPQLGKEEPMGWSGDGQDLERNRPKIDGYSNSQNCNLSSWVNWLIPFVILSSFHLL